MEIALERHTKKIYSQCGEDGIIEKVFDVLQVKEGYAVELGAWDGVHLSNTYNLIKQNWGATLIEGSPKKFKKLKKNMKSYPKVNAINKMVNLEGKNLLNTILKEQGVPQDFDLLSLDLDGCDYWVWESLDFKPKMVIIEYNANWKTPTTIPYNANHTWDGTKFYGASSLALKKLADLKGYDLVACLPYINLVFIDKEYNQGRFKVIEIDKRFFGSVHKPMSTIQQKSLINI